jgi:electron transfer flavoprotein beta subunit
MNETGRNIVITVAPVHDCRNPVVLDPSRGRIDPASRRWVLNPPDMIALEQALRIRDRNPDFRILVVSIAPPSAEHALRECLAVGANEVVRVWGEGVEDADPQGLAVILAAVVRRRPFHLILGGWRRADVEHAQTGPMLAELLGLPQITCARGVEMGRDSNSIRVEKRIPGKMLTMSCSLPALVTMEKGPPLRYPRHPDRRRARKIPITGVDPGAIGLAGVPPPLVLLERVTSPKPRRRSALGAAAGIPVIARLQRILSGGAQEKKESTIRPCPDKASTLKTVEYLLKEKLVLLP